MPLVALDVPEQSSDMQNKRADPSVSAENETGRIVRVRHSAGDLPDEVSPGNYGETGCEIAGDSRQAAAFSPSSLSVRHLALPPALTNSDSGVS